jgi:hypothetical protein
MITELLLSGARPLLAAGFWLLAIGVSISALAVFR